MAEDIDAGANYLASLRQSTRPQSAAAAAPARAPEAPPQNASSPNSSTNDKRKSARYKCKGSARIQEVGGTVPTWATFSDISLHGCYIETATPSRQGSALTVKLDANGFHVEATGEVRVAYSGLGMGVSFESMSGEDRFHLRELVRSITPPCVVMTQRLSPRSASMAPPPSEPLPEVTNPGAVLQAVWNFLDERHVMGREEFLKILHLHH
jgi:PilZ domain